MRTQDYVGKFDEIRLAGVCGGGRQKRTALAFVGIFVELVTSRLPASDPVARLKCTQSHLGSAQGTLQDRVDTLPIRSWSRNRSQGLYSVHAFCWAHVRSDLMAFWACPIPISSVLVADLDWEQTLARLW